MRSKRFKTLFVLFGTWPKSTSVKIVINFRSFYSHVFKAILTNKSVMHQKSEKKVEIYVKSFHLAASSLLLHGPRFSRSGKSQTLVRLSCFFSALVFLISRGRQQPVAPSVSLWNANRNIWIEKLLKRQFFSLCHAISI